jgi:hypothetical protein
MDYLRGYAPKFLEAGSSYYSNVGLYSRIQVEQPGRSCSSDCCEGLLAKVVRQVKRAEGRRMGITAFEGEENVTRPVFRKKVSTYDSSSSSWWQASDPCTGGGSESRNLQYELTCELLDDRFSTFASTAASGGGSQSRQSSTSCPCDNGNTSSSSSSYQSTTTVSHRAFADGLNACSHKSVQMDTDWNSSSSSTGCDGDSYDNDDSGSGVSYGNDPWGGWEATGPTTRQIDGGNTVWQETLSEEFTDEELEGYLTADLESVGWPSHPGDVEIRVLRDEKRYRYQFDSDEDFEAGKQGRIDNMQGIVDGQAETIQGITDAIVAQQEAIQANNDLVQEKIAEHASLKAEVETLKQELCDFEIQIIIESQKASRRTDDALSWEEIEELQDEYTRRLRGSFEDESGEQQEGFLQKQHRLEDLANRYIPLYQRNAITLQERLEELEANKALAELQATEYENRLAAAQANESTAWTEYRLRSPSLNPRNEGNKVGGYDYWLGTRRMVKMRYRLEVNVAHLDNEGQSYRVKWRERTREVPPERRGLEPDAEWTPSATFTEKEETVSATPESGTITTGWHEIDVPAYGYEVDVVGLQAESELEIVNMQSQGATERKEGVAAYRPSGSQMLRVFRREDFSGSFAGCTAANLDPTNYAGSRWMNEEGRWETEGIYDDDSDLHKALFGEPIYGDLLGYDIDDDGNSFPYYEYLGTKQFWPLDLWLMPTINRSWSTGRKFPKAVEETETRRVIEREVQCGTRKLRQFIESNLSDEFQTTDLRALVADKLAEENSWRSESWRKRNDRPFPDPQAIDYLHPNELTYERRRLRFRLRCTVPFIFRQPITETCHYVVKRMDLLTGAVTETSESVTFRFNFLVDWDEIQQARDNGEPYIDARSSWLTSASVTLPPSPEEGEEQEYIELDASANEMVWIDELKGQERPEYAERMIYFKGVGEPPEFE